MSNRCPIDAQSFLHLLQVIAKAKVPIVKFEDAETGYAFDISFDVANGPEVGSSCMFFGARARLACMGSARPTTPLTFHFI